ncbi:MAG: galactose oxidase [Opitutaceae bacterium]
MKPFDSIAFLAGLVSTVSAAGPIPSAASFTVTALAPLPDFHGFAGMFAGVSGGGLLCAGGTNFPEKPLAEGGRKIWHDSIFALAEPGAVWREIGRLPKPSAYGVSATWRDTMVLAGGGDAQGNSRDSRLMRWDGTRLAFEALPPLPITIANGCGTVVGDIFYVAGGQEKPTSTSALRRCFALDLAASHRAWHEIPWPAAASGRILAVAASHAGWFYLFSGADLFPNASGAPDRRYLTDAWRYRPASGWERLADLPHAVAAAPSPAMAVDGRLVIAGGVWPGFLATIPPHSPHPGFPASLLAYDPATGHWSEWPAHANPSGPPPRVTAPLVAWAGRFVIPSGEIVPGIRTPTVLTYQFSP